MKKFTMIMISKKFAYVSILILFLLIIALKFTHTYKPKVITVKQELETIVIDPGHGGVDGGTEREGILEKEINLDIGKKLKAMLEQNGYNVIMTREDDVSLDKRNNSSKSRHQRDLNERVAIINNSNAKLFISIHVNSNPKKPSTNGSMVFYSKKSGQNKVLAYCVQKALNNVEVDGKKRTIHDPVQNRYFILNNSKIPGILVETAFISNTEERQALVEDEFKEEIAKAILLGIEDYVKG